METQWIDCVNITREQPSESCAQFWIHSLDSSPPFTPLLGIAGDLLTAIIQTNINDVTTSTLDVSFPIN